MKVTGSRDLDAPRDAVFAAIHDPETLLAMLPGCREIARVSPTEYRGRLAIRLPAIVGMYETSVRLVESVAPEYSRFDGRVDGRIGSIAGAASFRLTAIAGRTRIDYEGEATVSGPLARLDGRFVENLARSLIDDGLARLDAQLQPARNLTMEIAP